MLLSFMAALVFHHLLIPTSGVDFLFNSFHNADDLLLVRDAQVESPVIRLTTGTNRPSIGRVFLQKPLQMTTIQNTTTTLSSFSTSFVFSILAEALNLPGFGIAFVLSNTTDPPSAIAGQYFGLFSRSIAPSPLFAVEFDTGYNQEFKDPNDNHVGIDLNIESAVTNTSGYWQGSIFVPIQMRSGRNIRAWIDFNGPDFQINVTLAPLGISRPSRPLISYTNPDIRNYISDRMFVGFSASKVGETWLERQRILAWSFADQGRPARELNTSNLPVFSLESASSSALSPGAIAGITSACFVLLVGLVFFSIYWFWWRRRIREKEMENVEEWELEYWPHRFSYEELCDATKGFSREHLLGYGGFGKVYKGVLMSGSNSTIVAVKCIAHNSKQGVREFMAEISSMGRLQHKNLVQMRGWCRRGTELMLVYDYMPNGSLNTHIFDDPEKVLGWEGRRQVLADVAEGLLYLHHGWDQMVLHRDIKSSNILLDSDGRGRLGDFGLAKLYEHGQVPGTTRVVGTLGYLAPELAHVPAPTPASDVYSFGVVMLEVASGRRPIGTKSEDDPLLIDWVRELYSCGKILEAADERLGGEYKAEEMETVLKLGLACCHPEPDHRPTMKEVVAVLVGEEATPAGLPGRLLLSLPRQSSGRGGY